MKIKRYMIFAGVRIIPSGGFKDFIGSEDNYISALKILKRINTYDWGHIIDIETGETVHEK